MSTDQSSQFGHFENTKVVNRIYKNVNELGLARHVMELDLYGFTVIPPEKVAPPEFVDKLCDTVLRIGEERTGETLSLDQNASRGRYRGEPEREGQFILYYLLKADPIFEEWVLNPTLYTMMDYLLQGQQQLSSLTAFFKSRGNPYDESMGLHPDSPPDRDGLLAPRSPST